MKYYLYDPLANNWIKAKLPEGTNTLDATKLNYQEFFDGLKKDDEVVLVGGDGTINHFVNNYDMSKIHNKIYLLANGTGNDFLKDINEDPEKEIELNKYLTNLPTVKIKNIQRKFINNKGFGIDRYCCEVADKIKKKPNKKIYYTAIAIKWLLFHFKPRHVSIEVDSQKYEFDNIWLAPTMNGRYYGGGMNIAPNQDRLQDKLSVVVYMSKSKLKALMCSLLFLKESTSRKLTWSK